MAFFHEGPIDYNLIMEGRYNWHLVFLSYLIASLASFVALDITERIRNSEESSRLKLLWLILGAFAMGTGIWTMHFIGMLAFEMPMPMHYELKITLLSMLYAIIASAFAFFLIRNSQINSLSLRFGGVILGLGIAMMHYTGMAAMKGVIIQYEPTLFFLSIIIAIVASEAALWLMIKSSEIKGRYCFLLKVMSALLMGSAICGMHYTGMEAAVFYMDTNYVTIHERELDIYSLSIYIVIMSLFIILIALSASRFWIYALQRRNQKLIDTEAKLVSTARVAGMAEVAAGVLHNIGNVLNSVNVTVQLLLAKNDQDRIGMFNQFSELLTQHKDNLADFITHHPIGKELPTYISQFSQYLIEEQNIFHKELISLSTKINHIKDIVCKQRALSGNSNIIEQASINYLIEEALSIHIETIEKYHITVKKVFQDLPHFDLEKTITLQILINLIKNSLDALISSKNEKKILILKTKKLKKDFIQVEVTDNGIGIREEIISQIFTYGFTTKKKGHGFGLHVSALGAQQLGGSLKAYSEGQDKGATFELILPMKIKIKQQQELIVR